MGIDLGQLDLRKRLADAGYVAVGLGVIGVQRAQSGARTVRSDLQRAADSLLARAEEARGSLRVQGDSVTARLDEFGHLVAPIAGRVRGLASR